jgi:(1->4)-alpha-D-glucan 1-alpha-D-glucosylmutase
VREGKVNSSWAEPDHEYEEALNQFIGRILEPSRAQAFLNDFRSFAAVAAWYGMLNSISQTVVKFTVPGIPDIYQGSELWNYDMVDPDNRRAVDFDLRSRMLEALANEFPVDADIGRPAWAGLVDSWPDGGIKLLIVSRLLRLRRAMPDTFQNGEYLALKVTGRKADHICAFARNGRDGAVIVIAPRLLSGLAPAGTVPGPAEWEDTTVVWPGPGGDRWNDVFTGRRHTFQPGAGGTASFPAAVMLDPLPISVLTHPRAADG